MSAFTVSITANPAQATAVEKHSKDLSHHSIHGGEKDLAKKSSSIAPNNANGATRWGRTKVGAA
ncbi:hypothetical protein SO802_008130 [Lithocarpus litseifolius]|uniref:Uncharacterized protein n=1 Tax=Lithocarpus litseifolius TaxID=425828 RepID=A0AAW2DAA4_9ROSI